MAPHSIFIDSFEMKKSLLLILAVLVCVGAEARSKKRDKKKAKTELVNTIPTVPADSLSYALGVVQASSMLQYLQQREAVDTAYIDVALSALTCNLPKEQVNRIIAFAAGLKIQQMNEQMVPNLNGELVGKPDSNYLVLPIMNQGLADAAKGELTMMSAELATQLVQRQQDHLLANVRIDGERFLEQNKDAEGVVTRESGLQYKVLTAGTGAVATDSSTVEVHYEGRLLNGTIFDSSYQRGKPITLKPTQVIKGWAEALKLMPEGSTWELYVPYTLGYGEQGTRNIPPYSVLIFKVQLLKVK